MKKLLHSFSLLLVIMLSVALNLPFFEAIAESSSPGDEDLSRLTYEQLIQLRSDIKDDYNIYHIPTEAQQNSVLGVTQESAEAFFTGQGLKVSGWAWYSSEYTYTKDWDYYTLKTHLDYKDTNNKSRKAIIYSEVYNRDGVFVVAYLSADDTVILDNKSDFEGVLWFAEPDTVINQDTDIDLSKYTVDELNALDEKAKNEIQVNHTVSKNEAGVVLNLTKSYLEQYCLKNNIEIKGYAWYDDEYIYRKDWDYCWLETHLDYKPDPDSPQKTSKIYSEVCKIGDNYELVYLRMDDNEIKNRKNELITTSDNGIPRYGWSNGQAAVNEPIAESEPVNSEEQSVVEVTPVVIYITPEPQTVVTPEVVYITPEPQPEVAPEVIYVTPEPPKGIFNVELTGLTDEQLTEAADAIRAEQRSRIKTHITLNNSELELFVGKTFTLVATVDDLPEDGQIPVLEWSTSDKAIVTCNNKGGIKAVSEGNATITCSAVLADGMEIYAECKIRVNVPVASFAVDNKNVKLSKGDKHTPVFTFRPENASNKELEFVSSDDSVARVAANGTITGVSAGQAKVTAKTMDGTEKSLVIAVTVTNDAYMKDANGQLLFELVISGERGSLVPEGGSADWYERAADVSGISFQVITEGKTGRLLIVEVLDIYGSGNRDIFYKVINCLFEGDDLNKAKAWVKSNLGRNARLKIGDANIILQRTEAGAPIMYISVDDYIDAF